MATRDTFYNTASSFPEITVEPHFEKTSFRIKNKIFATLSSNEENAVVKLSPLNQSVFCSFDKKIIYPVKGKWGLLGWTMIDLKEIKNAMLKDILTNAYCEVAPKSLSEHVANKP